MKKDVLIADPREAFRQELQAMFTSHSKDTQVHEAVTCQELLEHLKTRTFDFIIVNQTVISDITILPRGKYLILAPQPDMMMLHTAHTQGACAYFHENAPISLVRQIAELPQGIFLTDLTVSAQPSQYLDHHLLFSINYEELTTREREVFRLLWNGFSKRDIAEQLHISENTIKAHVVNIYNKLHLNRNRLKILSILHDPEAKPASG